MFTKICWASPRWRHASPRLGSSQATPAATGAPQEAAGAAMALAIAVIPYVFTRCIEGMSSKRGDQ